MALSQRTPPHIEEAVIERHRMGMTIASIEKEVPVSNNTIRRITQGLARDQIDETLLPQDRLWFKSDWIYRYVKGMVGEERLAEYFLAQGKGSGDEKLWRRVSYWVEGKPGGWEWMRFDTMDEFFCKLGLLVEQLPDPVFFGYDREKSPNSAAAR